MQYSKVLQAVMLFDDVGFSVDWSAVEKIQPLCRELPAFEIQSAPDGRERLGRLSSLPAGAELENCGNGFNRRTMKVRHKRAFYFVFLRDLEAQRNNSFAIA